MADFVASWRRLRRNGSFRLSLPESCQSRSGPFAAVAGGAPANVCFAQSQPETCRAADERAVFDHPERSHKIHSARTPSFGTSSKNATRGLEAIPGAGPAPLRRVDGSRQFIKIMLLIQSIGAAKALAEYGQVLFGQETHRNGFGAVRHGNAKLPTRRFNGGPP